MQELDTQLPQKEVYWQKSLIIKFCFNETLNKDRYLTFSPILFTLSLPVSIKLFGINMMVFHLITQFLFDDIETKFMKIDGLVMEDLIFSCWVI